ncbi:DUF6583 family protein, partial [uncultured Gemmiger sp.]|uniref:DUF6583 family protein n=1 Tax=uncultured Gemmiger sp. TaxID=1623490 RepID=UPI0025F0B415
MMTKKKRTTILIVIILLVLLILGTTFILLYINTDMFKSSQTLFVKYLGKNSDNIKALETILNNTTYDEQLQTSPYNDNIEVSVNYTQNIGTTDENTNNSINQLKVTVEGQTDKNNGYDYRDVKLLKNGEQVSQVELLHSSNNYGIKFTDLFDQYVASENTNLKELFKKIGYSDEQIENIPDTVNFDEDILSELKFSDEEVLSLEEKYVGIVAENVSSTNFSKQSNQTVSINEQDYITNAYVLTLTKEQLNNIYINLLQAVEQDETILGKIDSIQNKINEITLGNSNINLRDETINRIDRIIQRINQSNIGSDETKIIVYESDGQTVRTRIETQDYQVNIDCLQLQDSTFAELLVSNDEGERYRITLDCNLTDISVKIQNNENTSTMTFEKSEEINNQFRDQKYNLEYQIDDKRVNVNISRTTEVTQNIGNVQNFNEENAVILSKLEEASAQEITNIVRTGLDTELETIRQEIGYQDIEQMLKDIGFIQDTTVLGSTGITETEKTRFNSTFELLQGENLSGENVTNSIQTIKN